MSGVVIVQHVGGVASPWVDIRDYGAIGDGTTDDTAAVVAALAGEVGGIYFPRGTYKVTSGLTVIAGSHILRGDGATLDFSTMTGGGYAVSIVPGAIDTYNNMPMLDGIRIVGPTSESYTTDGMFIGRPSGGSGNTAHHSFYNMEIYGFRDNLFLGDQTWCNSFIKCKFGKAWRYGINVDALTNSGENFNFYGSLIYNCANAAHTAIGYYSPKEANADSYFFGCSFDYNDIHVSFHSGIFSAQGCHLENNNDLPQIYLSHTGGYEPAKLFLNGCALGTGPGGSLSETSTGRPTFISVAGDRSQVHVRDTNWGRYGKPDSELVTITSGSPYVLIEGINPITQAQYPPKISTATDRVYNGGFELGTFGGWTQNGGSGVTQSVDSSVKRTGSYSFKSVGTDSGVSSSITQKLSVVPGRYLLLRAFVKMNSTTNGSAVLQVKYYAQDDSQISSHDLKVQSADTDWLLVGDHKVIPAGAYYARIQLYQYQHVGTIYWDDVQAWLL